MNDDQTLSIIFGMVYGLLSAGTKEDSLRALLRDFAEREDVWEHIRAELAAAESSKHHVTATGTRLRVIPKPDVDV